MARVLFSSVAACVVTSFLVGQEPLALQRFQVADAPGSLAALIASAPIGAAEAQEFRGLRLEGHDTRAAVRDVVKGLDWHERLPDAERVAAKAQKPILWIHALGDLKGFT